MLSLSYVKIFNTTFKNSSLEFSNSFDKEAIT